MKWMAVILMLQSHERIDKFDMTGRECQAWVQQQYYSPQYPLSGPFVIMCERYWEA